MEYDAIIRVKGKPNTKYEGKEGVTTQISLYDIHGKRLPINPDTPVFVLWNGEKEKEFVELRDLDIIE